MLLIITTQVAYSWFSVGAPEQMSVCRLTKVKLNLSNQNLNSFLKIEYLTDFISFQDA